MKVKEKQEAKEIILLDKSAKKSMYSKRWKEEIDDDYRTAYQRDIGRILFSDAFRRLRMKTQIFFVEPTNQHCRTRLTHSLEVSQMARSISNALNLNSDLVEAIALAHDLGHTPFGHAGEKALNECMQETSKYTFHHNAQSVWVVTKTMAGRKDMNNKLYPGFNLTFDVVEGIWKHTDIEDTFSDFDDLKKIKDLNYKDSKGSLEAQVVNISDGIAYIRHDIEDAQREGIISFEDFEDKVWKKYFDTEFNRQNWINGFVHDLITNNDNLEVIEFSNQYKDAYKAIKKYIFENVIKSDRVIKSDSEGIKKIKTIYEYCYNNPNYLTKKIQSTNLYKIEKYGVERAVVDYIQWCGDELANKLYNGIVNKTKLP